MNSAGTVNVTVLNAQFASQPGAARNTDAYVVLRVGQNECKTTVARAMGATPAWNQSFSFGVSAEQTLEVELHEEELGRSRLLSKATVQLPRASEPRAMTQVVKMNETGGREVATLYLNVGLAPGVGVFPGLRQGVASLAAPISGTETRSYTTYAQQGVAAPVGGFAASPSAYLSAPSPPIPGFPQPSYTTGLLGNYAQPLPAGGYTQTTPIPGGYTQTTNLPNGYVQTTQTSTGYSQPAGYTSGIGAYMPPYMPLGQSLLAGGYAQTAPSSYLQGSQVNTGYAQPAPTSYVQGSQTTQASTGYGQSTPTYAQTAQTANAAQTTQSAHSNGAYVQSTPAYAQTTQTTQSNGAYAQSTPTYAQTTSSNYAQSTPAYAQMGQSTGFTPTFGGYVQTTSIPGGYAQTATYPNGYSQASFTQSSSQTPPTTTVTYGPNNTTTSTTYSSSESAYQSSQSNYTRLR